MKTTKLFLSMLMIAAVSLVSSCKKESKDKDSDVSGASDNNLAENSSSDITNIGSQAADGGGLSSYRLGDQNNVLACASVSIVGQVITVSFNGTSCMDGRIRTGTLTFDYSSSTSGALHYRDPGFKCVVTSTDYTVDGNQIFINSKSIENTTPVGFDKNVTNETWKVTANIRIVKTDGKEVSWVCERTKTLLNTSTVYTNAATAIDWANARIQIDGSANGSRASGESFTVTASGLVRDFTCSPNGNKHPFISGNVVYTPSNKSARTIDFGDGTCDLIATVMIDGIKYTIQLP